MRPRYTLDSEDISALEKIDLLKAAVKYYVLAFVILFTGITFAIFMKDSPTWAFLILSWISYAIGYYYKSKADRIV